MIWRARPHRDGKSLAHELLGLGELGLIDSQQPERDERRAGLRTRGSVQRSCSREAE
jgi:hypothetical protein